MGLQTAVRSAFSRSLGIPVDHGRSLRFIVTGDSGRYGYQISFAPTLVRPPSTSEWRMPGRPRPQRTSARWPRHAMLWPNSAVCSRPHDRLASRRKALRPPEIPGAARTLLRRPSQNRPSRVTDGTARRFATQPHSWARTSRRRTLPRSARSSAIAAKVGCDWIDIPTDLRNAPLGEGHQQGIHDLGIGTNQNQPMRP